MAALEPLAALILLSKARISVSVLSHRTTIPRPPTYHPFVPVAAIVVSCKELGIAWMGVIGAIQTFVTVAAELMHPWLLIKENPLQNN